MTFSFFYIFCYAPFFNPHCIYQGGESERVNMSVIE